MADIKLQEIYMSLIAEYKAHTEERAKLGIPPLALTAAQTAQLIELLKADSIEEQDFLMDLFENKINPGVDDAAYVKAGFLAAVTKGEVISSILSAYSYTFK